jgi:RNA polymerase sigma-70 factor (ECF subfamily)
MHATSVALSIDGADDATLMQRICVGDANALSDLYERYKQRALALAYRAAGNRVVAEEIVQEAFVSIWRHAHTYKPSLGPVRPWIFTIVQNAAIDSLRHGRGMGREASLEEAWMAAAGEDVFRDAYLNVQRGQVWRCLRDLPEEQRTAIRWVYYSGRSFAEISRRTGVPVGTLKSRVRLGVSKLRRMLAPVA